MFEETIHFIRSCFGGDGPIALHEPVFSGREREYLNECIETSFVSSVGKYVDRFEKELAAYTGCGYAVATVNGTAALHASLLLAGVVPGDEVLTQPLTFVATANAITYCGAEPSFVDIDEESLGMSPDALRLYLSKTIEPRGGVCRNRFTGKVIRAVVPMHTFGHPVRIDEIAAVCEEFGLSLVEDAAESLGSFYKGRHTGSIGRLAAFSFNGNKTITCGGGGAIVTNDKALAQRAKHITTTAKVPHRWDFIHDEVGFNYRMPNLNAALACAQLEQIDPILENKRELAMEYAEFFGDKTPVFVSEPAHARSNYWLNAIRLEDQKHRDLFLKEANDAGIMVRPAWMLLHRLGIYANSRRGDLSVAEELADRLVNIPSGVREIKKYA